MYLNFKVKFIINNLHEIFNKFFIGNILEQFFVNFCKNLIYFAKFINL